MIITLDLITFVETTTNNNPGTFKLLFLLVFIHNFMNAFSPHLKYTLFIIDHKITNYKSFRIIDLNVQ